MPYLRSNMQSLAIHPANDDPEPPANARAHPNSTTTAAPSVAPTEKAANHDLSTQDAATISPRQDRARRLKAKNRRKRYLDTHPEYLHDTSLELAHPLLYDRLIRRFQTAAEREAEGQRKGFSAHMATALWRAEAAMSDPDPGTLFTYTHGPNGEIHEADKEEVPMTREEGKTWWADEMTQRFLRGADEDFEYEMVDGCEAFDDPEEERDIQDAYFDSFESDFDTDGEGKEKVLTGETGIQDY